jgi:Ca2+/H+ antiporter, TMEM165/GDT1 family
MGSRVNVAETSLGRFDAVDLAVIGIAFAAIFVVELPDKTFVAALVLATRYKPWAVWIGVGLAFFVQTLIACTVGHVVTLLPHEVVEVVAAVIFLAGAVLLFRAAPRADVGEAEAEEEYAAKASTPKAGLAAVGASFLVLFAAEWGDLSQLLTISLVGRYHDAVSVFIGAWTALLVVSGLAVIAGRFLLRHMRLSTIHYLGAAVCLLLAGVTIYQLIAG